MEPRYIADSGSRLDEVRLSASKLSFFPLATIRCVGQPLFRSRTARDYACLLDLDPSVSAWHCLPVELVGRYDSHIPDFLVNRGEGRRFASVGINALSDDIEIAARADADGIDLIAICDLDGFRLTNARDLLRYGRWQAPLNDRVRLLAALDEHGALTVAEAMTAFQECRPIPGIASLVLNRFIEMELDGALIGPETMIRRLRD